MNRPQRRTAAPHQDGPLGSSGAALEQAGTGPAGKTAGGDGTPTESAPDTTPKPAADTTPEPAPDTTPEPAADAAPEPAVVAEADTLTGTASGDKGPDGRPPGDPDTGDRNLDGQKPADEEAAGDAERAPTDPPTRRLRRASPVRAVRYAGRSTSAWAKRPSGRLILPAIIAALLVGAAGTAGAYLVPEALQPDQSPTATPGFPRDATATSAPPNLPTGSAPAGPSGPPPTTAPLPPVRNGARPADALAGWAQQIGTKVGIPVVAAQAYGYAELVVAKTLPSCHLSWTTIAAIGKIESSHGSANGAVLSADGSVQPPIYGLPLDGRGGRQQIRDSDQGTIDADTTYDRAVGPLQFIPSTWIAYKVDADNSGVADPNDIDDASLTAATYLCQGGRDMSKADSWWDAILSYNAVRPYAQKVFEAANDYGQRSRL